ncbi:hypothetical protein ACN1C3_30180 [Pseudomonas sp. H11T01]|uniref:hypothetical protein n=1 Tax=Pseudomonas sp. H11T01 TaxID=3402749 RepID=UPI003ACA647A
MKDELSAEQQQCLLSHLQFTAKHFQAFRGNFEKLVELVRYSVGEAAPDANAIGDFLRLEETQKTLELSYETALWRSADHNKSWRLICLAIKADPEVAKRRLARRPPSTESCSFCWQNETGFTEFVLQPEKDIYGNAIPGVYLHRQCSRPWKLMRDLVARAQTTTKENLL